MKHITGYGGVKLAVRVAGDPANPAVVLIHGWSQNSLSWENQLRDLADRFYLIAPDLRGHGASDAPSKASAYDTSAPWAGDVAAIIEQLDLDAPMLVGWSMGGWVVGDYLRRHGDAALSSVVLVGSAITTGRHSPDGATFARDADVQAKGMLSDDWDENLEATQRFVRACTAKDLDPDTFTKMVEMNMQVRADVRRASRIRHKDYRAAYRDLKVPALILWGDQERLALPPFIDEMLDVIPTAHSHCLTGLGHAPMLEDPARFNAALSAFAQSSTKVAA